MRPHLLPLHLALLLATLSLAACAAQAPPTSGRDTVDPEAKSATPASDDATAGEDVAPDGRGGGTSANPVIPAVPLGQPFRLPYDHLVRVGDTGVRLRFEAVLEDSRCPRDVACVWAGRARVRVALMPREGSTETLELGTESGRETAAAAGLQLVLQGIEPLRTAGGADRTPAEQYALTLVARRAG
jgi:hypothetical protein